MKLVNIIKFGGAVITDPGAENLFHRVNVSRLARELRTYHRGCIIVHGTGHVGKPPAIEYNYYKTGILEAGNTEIGLTIRHSIRQLHLRLVRELIQAGIPAISMETPREIVSPSNNGELLPMDENIPKQLHQLTENRKKYLTQLTHDGLVPVFSADFIPQPDGTFKVLSSDQITLWLARILRPDKVLFLTDVDGVYRNHHTPDQSIMRVFTENDLQLFPPAESKDVSGGMLKKAETALQAAQHCRICMIGNGFTKGVLKDFLTDTLVHGTRVTNYQV